VQTRLNKYLSSLGIASRRQVDQMISRYEIIVNDKPAHLGQKIDPTVDLIKVRNQLVAQRQPSLVYFALNKPAGVLSTTKDTHGRKTIMDFIPSTTRLFPIGRLDVDTTGLILLTNDGDLALKLTHPRYHLPKTYIATVKGKTPLIKLDQLQDGVQLDDGLTQPAIVELVKSDSQQSIIKITLFQGKKRQIRRMFAALHIFLISLERIQIGSLSLGNLMPGQYRPLTLHEVKLLSSTPPLHR
jgi:23S rRNA pseudouridine2605 synthase